MPTRPGPSYAIFGYDAMRVLGQAFANCSQGDSVTRLCIKQEIGIRDEFAGACGVTYQFSRGERVNAGYYVYAVDPVDGSGPRFRQLHVLTNSDLQATARMHPEGAR